MGRALSRASVSLAILVVGIAVAAPLIILLILSFQSDLRLGRSPLTIANYSALVHLPGEWSALRNTLIFTVGGSLLAVVLGTIMAWAVTSVNVPANSVLRVLPLCALILPPLVKDPAWVIAFAPKTGLANILLHSAFGISKSALNVFSLPGMAVAAGMFTAPIAYIIMLGPFERLDRDVLDASRMSGARIGYSATRVLLPMVRPALLSAVTLIIILIASSFETPIIIGMPAGIQTYMSLLYQQVDSPALGLNLAAAQGCVYLVLTGIMVLLYIRATRHERRFVTISGRGNVHEILRLPVIRWLLFAIVVLYCAFAFVLPLVITALTSLVSYYSAVAGNPYHSFTLANFRYVFKTPEVVSAIETSSLLAIGVAFGVVVVAGVLSYTSLKGGSRFRRICEWIAMAPIAVPALVYSVGLLLTVSASPAVANIAYGQKWVMLIAEIVIFLPLTMRLISSALVQVQNELLEVSRTSAAGPLRTVFHVVLPILRPSLMYAMAVVFVLSYRELGGVIFLVANNVNIVANLSLTFWLSGGYPDLCALSVVTLVPPLVLVCAAFLLARREKHGVRVGLSVRSDSVPDLVQTGA